MKTDLGDRRHSNTIRDVAASCGCRISTVSKALNGGGRMRAETREKVKEAANTLGLSAEQPCSKPAPKPQPHHRHHLHRQVRPLYLPDCRGNGGRLANEGIGVFMCNATDDPEREKQHIRQLLGKRMDGIVVTARRADKRRRIELIGSGHSGRLRLLASREPNALSLLPDDEGGAVLAVEHLAEPRPAADRPYHRARRFRSRTASPAGLCPRPGSRPECLSRRNFYLSGVWSEAWGREAVAKLLLGRTAGCHLLRQRPDCPRRERLPCAKQELRSPTIFLSSAMTTGK